MLHIYRYTIYLEEQMQQVRENAIHSRIKVSNSGGDFACYPERFISRSKFIIQFSPIFG